VAAIVREGARGRGVRITYRGSAIMREVWRRPPEARPLIEYAKTCRFGEPPNRGERYDPHSHPGQYWALRLLPDRRWAGLKLLGPVQDGKTWAGQLVPTMWLLFERKESVTYGAPDLPLLSKLWLQKLRPAIEETYGSSVFPGHGPGSREGSRLEHIRFHGASLNFIGAGGKNEAGQAGVTSRGGFQDEYDSIKPYFRRLIHRRTSRYGGDAIRCDTSTLKTAYGQSFLWSEYEHSSTASRIALRCPHTGYYVIPEYENLEFDRASPGRARATARLIFDTPSGVVEWTEQDRKVALRDTLLVHAGQQVVHSVDGEGRVVGAEVVGPVPDVEYAGLRWNCFHSPLAAKALPEIAAQYQVALVLAENDDDTALKSIMHDEFVREYSGSVVYGEGLEPKAIAIRTTNHERNQIPDGTVALTMGIDPGGARTGIHWWLWAWLPTPRPHCPAYGRIAPWATAGEEVLAALTEFGHDFIAPGWNGFHVDLVYVDANWETDHIIRWCKAMGFNRFKPVRGFSRTHHKWKNYNPKKSDGSKDVLRHDRSRGVPMWFEERLQRGGRRINLDADFYKRRFHSACRTPMGQARAMSLHHVRDPKEHLELPEIEGARHVPGAAVQICSEHEEFSEKHNAHVWVRTEGLGGQSHFLDAGAYGLAAGDYLGVYDRADRRPPAPQAARPQSRGMVTPDGRPFHIHER